MQPCSPTRPPRASQKHVSFPRGRATKILVLVSYLGMFAALFPTLAMIPLEMSDAVNGYRLF